MRNGFEVRFLAYALLAAVFLIGSGAFTTAVPCDLDTLLDPCWNTFPISSADGYGAAEICGDCYICGMPDGVCPEEFRNSTGEETIGNCSNCNDPDCNITMEGFVYEADAAVPEDNPISNARVSAVGQNPNIPLVETTTDNTGFYHLEVPTSGRLSLSASSIGLDTHVIERSILSKNIVEQDFHLPNASCDQNCADYFGRCNKACQGLNGCDYVDWNPTTGTSEIADACHQRRLGDRVEIGGDLETTDLVVCCDGSEQYTQYTPESSVEGKMSNLMDTAVPVLYNGVPVIMHIATW